MTSLEALILGIVEGITEFLPVSSTGHLILTGYFLKIQNTDANKAFEIVIQGGATLAVVWHYRTDLYSIFRGLFKKDRARWRQFAGLGLAFLPAATLGFFFGGLIKEHLFGVRPVIYAMIAGGLAILFTEKHFEESGDDFEVSPAQAFVIGLFQCLALWPGVSRSMATLLGGRIVGLNAKGAAKFSFLLAIPTLVAASGHDLLKHRQDLLGSPEQVKNILIGLISAYLVSLVVIRGFLRFLATKSLNIFGWYRIIFGFVLFFLFH